MTKKTKMVFGCSPYHGKVKSNVGKARRYARFIASCGYSPVMPQLFFPQFLDDSKPDERAKSFELATAQLKRCDEMWIFGTKMSKGMKYEIEKAKELDLLVRLFDDECREINPETIEIDNRMSPEVCRIINGLRFV